MTTIKHPIEQVMVWIIFIPCINNILITDIINNELELLSNYSKRAKEHKTLIKTNDKKKKMQ